MTREIVLVAILGFFAAGCSGIGALVGSIAGGAVGAMQKDKPHDEKVSALTYQGQQQKP